jgi:hypothetical protein
MGKSTTPSINEAVFVLNQLEPYELEQLRKKYPQLLAELKLGRIGGSSLPNDELNKARANVVSQALLAIKRRADHELLLTRTRMVKARKNRLRSQIAALICSSGVLGAIAIGNNAMSIVSAVLSLLASVGVMLAEQTEKLLKQGDGDIYSAYESAGQASYKAGLAYENLLLLMRYDATSHELDDAVSTANGLCEELNSWVLRIAGSASQ